MSSVSRSGTSIAGKWPPRSYWVQCSIVPAGSSRLRIVVSAAYTATARGGPGSPQPPPSSSARLARGQLAPGLHPLVGRVRRAGARAREPGDAHAGQELVAVDGVVGQLSLRVGPLVENFSTIQANSPTVSR